MGKQICVAWWQTFLLGRSIFWGVSCTEGIRLVPIPISTLISADLGVDSSSEIAWFECSEEKILEKKNTLPETSRKDISSFDFQGLLGISSLKGVSTSTKFRTLAFRPFSVITTVDSRNPAPLNMDETL